MKTKLLVLILFTIVAYQLWAVSERFLDYIWYLYKFYGYGYPDAKFVSMRSIFINLCVTALLISIIFFLDKEYPKKKIFLRVFFVITVMIWLMIAIMFIGL